MLMFEEWAYQVDWIYVDYFCPDPKILAECELALDRASDRLNKYYEEIYNE